jgi:hypothetical protein
MDANSQALEPESAKVEVDLANLGTFKFWRIQKANAAKLLKEIIFRWRGASAYVPGKPGKWVVWPRERWSEWTGLSRNQLDRALRELVETNLVNRERHRFAGSEVRSFLRPTLIALKHLGRPEDMAKAVGVGEQTCKNLTGKTGGKIMEKTGDKANEKTDYTSLPLNPIDPTKTTTPFDQTASSTLLIKEGMGKDGEDEDELDKLFAAHSAKKQIVSDKLFPESKGPHQKYVKHPSKMHKNWLSFSKEVQVKLQLKYLEYVENWYKGKKGTSCMFYFTDDEEMALIADHEKKKAAKKAAAG